MVLSKQQQQQIGFRMNCSVVGEAPKSLPRADGGGGGGGGGGARRRRRAARALCIARSPTATTEAARMVPTDARTAPGASREPRTESLISARSSPRTTESPRRAHTNTYTHTHIYSQYYADFMRVKIVDNFF
ncbi:uncharacterized protein [Choristoneura fumiferana]|uniref:uncharacterized protein n=1 Tax=Choristoneura fumiferana TaxID=7141 RepID=UPI003D15E7E3